MSVFGSLFTAVSGLSAQSGSIAMISNNIANVSTVGFKRTDAAFSSLVTGSSSTAFSPGSVRSIQNARISQQGILQQSSSPSDIALSGNGFFVVRPSTTDPLAETLYTRAGSFSEDANGTLRNAAGFFLYGWPLDQDGGLPAAQADLTSLVPVDVAFLGGLTQPTSTAGLSLNLKAGEVQTAYPVPVGFTPDFTRGIKVYDSLGEGHDLTVNYKKMATPTARVTGNVDLRTIVGPFSANPPFLVTDQFNITVGATGPVAITLNGDVTKLLSDLNAIQDASFNPVLYAQLDANGFLSIKARNTGQNITLANGGGNPLNAAKLGMAASIGITAAPAAPTLLTPLAETPNTEGWWQVEFQTPLGGIIESGAINFTGAGQLNGLLDLQNQTIVDLDDIDWGNGSDLQDIEFDLSGFTQFSGEYNVIASTQNGAELGLRTGITIDEEGFVTAQFSNGQSTRIYKLAVATFANPNGLDNLTGNVFRESTTSGSFNLREAGQGGAGDVASGALEASNVDLADEFSRMIVTQRAYSANTKVISTADQMTEELLRLR